MGKVESNIDIAKKQSRPEVLSVTEPSFPLSLLNDLTSKTREGSGDEDGKLKSRQQSRQASRANGASALAHVPVVTNAQWPKGRGGSDEGRYRNEEESSLPTHVIISTATAVTSDPSGDFMEEIPTAHVVEETTTTCVASFLCCVLRCPSNICFKKVWIACGIVMIGIVVVIATTASLRRRRQQITAPVSLPDKEELPELMPSQSPTFASPSIASSAGTTTPTQSAGGGSCVDLNGMCEKWASVGECVNNPGYMLLNCKKSCLVCESGGFRLRSMWDQNYCLDVKYASAVDFTPLQINRCNDTPAQRFRLDTKNRLRTLLNPVVCIEMDPEHGVFIHSACLDTWTFLIPSSTYQIDTKEGSSGGSGSVSDIVLLKNDGDGLCVWPDLGEGEIELKENTEVKRGDCTDDSTLAKFLVHQA